MKNPAKESVSLFFIRAEFGKCTGHFIKSWYATIGWLLNDKFDQISNLLKYKITRIQYPHRRK
jgi:hypothetical protein